VIGPVGAQVKIKAGCEAWAKLVEVAIGPQLLTQFVCDNLDDIPLLRNLRKKTGCNSSEMNIVCQRPGPRYKINGALGNIPIDGITLALDVLNVQSDLVFNCLCDSARLERKALATDRVTGDRKLVRSQNNRFANIYPDLQETYFYPDGDHFSVKQGNLSLRSNDRAGRGGLTQRIGGDAKTAVREAQNDLQYAKEEYRGKKDEMESVAAQLQDSKKAWNHYQKKSKDLALEVKRLEGEIEDLTEQVEEGEEQVRAATHAHRHTHTTTHTHLWSRADSQCEQGGCVL